MTGSEKLHYLDSSVALRIILGHSQDARSWFDADLQGVQLISSKLLQLEVVRAMRREKREPAEAEPVIDQIVLLNLDTELLDEAAAIEPHVKSLDALHLATALRAGTDYVVIVTHDEGMARAARHLGFEVLDPVQ